MRLSKLDGYGRIHPEMNGKPITTKRAKRLARQTMLANQEVAPGKSEATKISNQSVSNLPTKRAKKARKQQMYNEGSNPNIGFSRIYEQNEPGSRPLQGSEMHSLQMEGFGRIKYTNKELQGLSLQGFTILQGYDVGDEEDLEDWNYLLSIEHPDTLQGFPAWEMQGRAERKARQAARRARREARKSERQSKRSEKKASRSKQSEARKAERRRKKEIRTAKKEERLQKKRQRRESRAERKKERLLRKKLRQSKREARKLEKQRLKQARKAEAAAGRRDIFAGAVGAAGDIASSLLRGRDDFEDFSIMDFEPYDLPSGFDSMIDEYRGMPSEDVLGLRDSRLSEMPEIDEGEFVLEDEEEEKDNTMLYLGLAAAGVYLLSKQGDTKKKK